MPARSVHAALNRGLVSRLGLAREDIERVGISGDTWSNWTPRVLGSMQIRPGLGHLDETQNGATSVFIPFVFSVTDKALIEFSDGAMRVWVDDTPITRNSVLSQTQNGNFATNITNWTDASSGGGTIGWQAGTGGAGFLRLTGTGTAYARARQTVTVNAQDIGVEHGLKVGVQTGPVTLRVGSATGTDDFISETILEAGGHSFAFTPTGNAFIEVSSPLARIILVDYILIEAAGPIVLPSPYVAADLETIRGGTDSQSGDIIYLAADGYEQWEIERWGPRSWSLVLYRSEMGPFLVQNTNSAHTMTVSVTTGNGTLTSSQAFFEAAHLGALFRYRTAGQSVSVTGPFPLIGTPASSALFINEIASKRVINITRSRNLAGPDIALLERSFVSSTGPWETALLLNATNNTTVTFNDALDGSETWYRVRITVLAGSALTITLDYNFGETLGIVRVTNYTSPTVVDVEILTPFSKATASIDWWEGQWSGVRGFPSAVCFYQGRLVWAGRDHVWLSASDDFYNFSDQDEGDAAAISRTIGTGAVDSINWLLPLQRLAMGADGAEFTVRSSSLDEPLTPTNCNLSRASTQGSARVQAVAIDSKGFFIQRGGIRVFDFGPGSSGDYEASHITALVPELGEPEFVRLAVQRQPDARLHCLRSDGTVALLIYDRIEEVLCWVEIETDGVIEDVVVLPGDIGASEDRVYYAVRRIANGVATTRLERWAFESETRGGAVCKLADGFISSDNLTFTDTASLRTALNAAIDHLAGRDVVVWANSADIGHDSSEALLYTVATGPTALSPPLPDGTTSVVVGLPYDALWRSTKLTRVQVQTGTTLTMPKAIQGIGFVLADIHSRGLKFGPSFTALDEIPMVFDGKRLGDDEILEERDDELNSFPLEFSSDARLCLKAMAPRPCTVMAVVLEMTLSG